MSGLFLRILCITKRGYQFRSFDSLATSASSTIEQRIIGSHGYKDEDLGEKAREAKQRLDHRLRSFVARTLQTIGCVSNPPKAVCCWRIRYGTKSKEERFKDVEDRQKKEMVGLKQNGRKTFSRVVKQWKDIENDECTICLVQFKNGYCHLKKMYREYFEYMGYEMILNEEVRIHIVDTNLFAIEA